MSWSFLLRTDSRTLNWTINKTSTKLSWISFPKLLAVKSWRSQERIKLTDRETNILFYTRGTFFAVIELHHFFLHNLRIFLPIFLRGLPEPELDTTCFRYFTCVFVRLCVCFVCSCLDMTNKTTQITIIQRSAYNSRIVDRYTKSEWSFWKINKWQY